MESTGKRAHRRRVSAEAAAREAEAAMKAMRLAAFMLAAAIVFISTIVIASCAGKSSTPELASAGHGRAIIAVAPADGGWTFSVASEDGIEEVHVNDGELICEYDHGSSSLRESTNEDGEVVYVAELSDGMALQMAEALRAE